LFRLQDAVIWVKNNALNSLSLLKAVKVDKQSLNKKMRLIAIIALAIGLGLKD
jgi:hypothetical protein